MVAHSKKMIAEIDQKIKNLEQEIKEKGRKINIMSNHGNIDHHFRDLETMQSELKLAIVKKRHFIDNDPVDALFNDDTAFIDECELRGFGVVRNLLQRDTETALVTLTRMARIHPSSFEWLTKMDLALVPKNEILDRMLFYPNTLRYAIENDDLRRMLTNELVTLNPCRAVLNRWIMNTINDPGMYNVDIDPGPDHVIPLLEKNPLLLMYMSSACKSNMSYVKIALEQNPFFRCSSREWEEWDDIETNFIPGLFISDPDFIASNLRQFPYMWCHLLPAMRMKIETIDMIVSDDDVKQRLLILIRKLHMNMSHVIGGNLAQVVMNRNTAEQCIFEICSILYDVDKLFYFGFPNDIAEEITRVTGNHPMNHPCELNGAFLWCMTTLENFKTLTPDVILRCIPDLRMPPNALKKPISISQIAAYFPFHMREIICFGGIYAYPTVRGYHTEREARERQDRQEEQDKTISFILREYKKKWPSECLAIAKIHAYSDVNIVIEKDIKNFVIVPKNPFGQSKKRKFGD